MKTTERVEALVKDAVETEGFALCDVEFQKEFGNWVLTLFIDKTGGVTIDDCEKISKLVDPILDEADPIGQAYYLSVSSLGLDRPLKKDADFARSLNARVEGKLYQPLPREEIGGGKKEFCGVLTAFDADTVTILTDAGALTLERKAIALIRPELTF